MDVGSHWHAALGVNRTTLRAIAIGGVDVHDAALARLVTSAQLVLRLGTLWLRLRL